MNKIGIMGGTFNPIHNAHLVLAEQAYVQCKLDKVLIMPAKRPPHKDSKTIESDEHRLEMVRLSIQENKHFELCTLEMERDDISYTAETLRILHSRYPDTEFYFIIGGDSLMSIDSWKKPEQIFALANIIATGRTGYSKEEISHQVDVLNKRYHTLIDILDIPNVELSSHYLREQVSNGGSIRYYVPEPVYQYIMDQGLYKNS